MRDIQRWSKAVVVVGTIVSLAACADREALAPTTGPRAGLALTASISTGDTVVTTFTVVPGSATTAVIGDHKIRIPGGAVCDPLLSSYGPSEWDKPCQALVAPLVITAKSWRNADGHPLVDFQPALRFRPTDKGVVTLYLMDKVASADPSYSIFYCGRGKCIDESLADPSLATQRDASNGFAYRQLKHFSGYVIAPRTDAAELDAAPMF